MTPTEKKIIQTLIQQGQATVDALRDLLGTDEAPDGDEPRHPVSVLPPEATLQKAVIMCPGLDSEDGLRVSEIARRIGRLHEVPNVDTALKRLADHGLAERVPGVTPATWRWATQWRTRAS